MILTDVDVTVQKCMGGAATKSAKTFQLVLNTLNEATAPSQMPKAEEKIGPLAKTK